MSFIVKANYYKVDTIVRKLTDAISTTEVIELKRDDYALMISYFASSDVGDWEKRRKQLDDMIDDDAIIFQISASNIGMEMYNKSEFIDKLTMPLQSLGNIDIVETIYKNGRIINLRFIQRENTAL